MLPKMSKDVPTISEHFRSYLKLFWWFSMVLKRYILVRSDTVRTQTRHRAPFIRIFSRELNWIWTSCPDLWVRREKLSSMHGIDVFDPQAWHSQSWQIYSSNRLLLEPITNFFLSLKGPYQPKSLTGLSESFGVDGWVCKVSGHFTVSCKELPGRVASQYNKVGGDFRRHPANSDNPALIIQWVSSITVI